MGQRQAALAVAVTGAGLVVGLVLTAAMGLFRRLPCGDGTSASSTRDHSHRPGSEVFRVGIYCLRHRYGWRSRGADGDN